MPWFNGHRSFKEQMRGLGPALAECRGKSVLDIGCAEGLIALEFARAGAAVYAFDNNHQYAHAAMKNCGTKVRVRLADMHDGVPFKGDYDIVLALAVLHKSVDVPKLTALIAARCRDLMVIRLPHGSDGLIRAKHGGSTCDLNGDMPAHGFTLERVEDGPRDERVQYWRRL